MPTKCLLALLFLLLLAIASTRISEGSVQLSTPLQEAQDSLLTLVNWKFHIDPSGDGQKNFWNDPAFDDSSWQSINGNKTWQLQGFPRYHGFAWYRARVNIPAEWKGSKILFHSEGIKEEYDLHVDGKFVRHFGSKNIPTGDVPTEADIGPFLTFGSANLVALRVKDHGNEGGVWRRTQIRRIVDLSKYKNLLPSPILESHPELVDLYWQSWRMAWEKVAFGSAENGFVPAYMEEGYSEQIFQWDSVFISMYGRYGKRLFPAMPTLDNFYLKQRPDGYIQRIYSKTTGSEVVELNPKLTMTNPPIFAWSEWDYYKITGDESRLKRVFPILSKYFIWIKKHQSSRLVPGMYWQTDWETGMDNMPRPNMELAGCVDMTLQQALAAKYLALMAHKLGEFEKEKVWRTEHDSIRDIVNRLSWSVRDGIYYDVDRQKHLTGVKQIGSMWSLVSGVASTRQAESLVKHLRDPREFYRRHLFPALAASDPHYSKEASYWAGGVWAPTNYMTIKGLALYGYQNFARDAALNHLNNMYAVYASKIDTNHIDPNEADGDYHTIWECYNPDKTCPCTRADKYYYGRQDFAGWTGVGPIALLIEQVIGMDIIGSENRVVWRLSDSNRVGLENFELKDAIVSLVAEPEKNKSRAIVAESTKPFRLSVIVDNKSTDLLVPEGKSRFELPPANL